MNIAFIHYDGVLGPSPHTKLSNQDAILWGGPVKCVPRQYVEQITRQPCFRLAVLVEHAASELQCTVEDIRTAAKAADVWKGIYTTTEPIDHWMEIHGAEFLNRLLPEVKNEDRGNVWNDLLKSGEAVTRVVDQFGTSIEVVKFDRLSKLLLKAAVDILMAEKDLRKVEAEVSEAHDQAAEHAENLEAELKTIEVAIEDRAPKKRRGRKGGK